MRSNVSPTVLAAIVVVAVIALGLLGWKYLGPNTGGGASENLSSGKVDISNLNPNDLSQVKKEIEAANAARNRNK